MIKLEELKSMATALTDIRRVDEKKMDKVDKDAVKGDFEDREDKDIDNDGDVDSSDRYLHNRRKAITKAMAKEETDLDEAKTPLSHRQGMIDKIKKSGVVKSGSMSKKSMKEKAESEAQAIAARIALKHKREGTKPEPGTASAEMMKMSEKDLEDFTKMKKGAPYKVEESTDLTEDAWEEIPMMKRQLHYIKYAADEIMEYMNMTADPEEWFQNKLAHVHDQMQSLHAYIEGDKRMMAMESTDEEIRAKQTAGATKPEGIADKESEGSKKFMMMHTTQVPGEVNADEINRMNAEEIKASLQRKISYRWNDQKIGDK